ncbi:hypothetical protein CFB81_34160 [Burkholderia sp. AU28863]|nr:hypothetical protein CFB81_34160 [Burkholderia sp. AU28863]
MRPQRIRKNAERRHRCGAGALADALHPTERTLRRRLDKDGITFPSPLDDVRPDEAVRWLDAHALTVAAIAERLGYSEPGHASIPLAPGNTNKNRAKSTAQRRPVDAGRIGRAPARRSGHPMMRGGVSKPRRVSAAACGFFRRPSTCAGRARPRIRPSARA